MLLLLLGCHVSPDPVGSSPNTSTARIDVQSAPEVAIPSCALLDACPQPELGTSACLDDPELFTVTMLEGAVASIELDPSAAVPDRDWFTTFPDPAGGCALTLFSFRGRG